MFGLDRAFLPMTLDGAMAEDIALLSLGYAYLLPDDNHGRAVFFWDRTGFTSRSASREAMLRCLFYNVHMLTFAVSDRKKGFVVVVNCRSFDLYKHFDRILSTNLRRLVEVAPLLLRGLHIGAGPGSSVLDLVMPVLKIIHGKRVRLRLQLHKGSDQEIVQSLSDYGLDKRHGMAVFSGTVYNQERSSEGRSELWRRLSKVITVDSKLTRRIVHPQKQETCCPSHANAKSRTFGMCTLNL